MPLASQALSESVGGLYTSSFPTCINGTFPHSPTDVVSWKMIDCMCAAWCSVIQAPNLVQLVYTGVTGSTSSAPPTVISFPAATAAVSTFLTNMAWVGPSASLVAKSFVFDIPTQTGVLGMLQCIPAPGAGPGTGVPSPGFAASAPTFVPLFQAALQGEFTTAIGTTGLPLFDPTSNEIIYLCTNLGIVYATILASMTFSAAYAGAPTAPVASPLSIPLTGSII
tara:strand:+ start:80 stop:751 length:672 start_codon:yes stop_codon:yes gene_type:complete